MSAPRLPLRDPPSGGELTRHGPASSWGVQEMDMPADPLTELLALLRQARREVAFTLPGSVEFCVVHRREVVHRLTRCTRRMGWPQA